MKLAIMQPYFFPYLGYFELINCVDKWIVFDIVQYNSKSWMSRNRILHPAEGWQYINIPVEKHSKGTLLKDIKVKSLLKTRDNIIGKLTHYKKKAPFYEQTISLINEAFSKINSNKLVDINVKLLESVSDYLELDFQYEICSELNLKLPEINYSGQWALEISDVLGAGEYINLPGGKEIFRQDEFNSRKIDLTFIDELNFKYDCTPYTFTGGLSIIDVLMWTTLEEIHDYLSRNKQ